LKIYQTYHNTINSTLAILLHYHICVPQKLHAKIKIANLTRNEIHTHLQCTCCYFSSKVFRFPRELQSLSWSSQLRTFYELKFLSIFTNSLQLVPILGHVTEFHILTDLFTIRVNIDIIVPPSPLTPFRHYDENFVEFLVSSTSLKNNPTIHLNLYIVATLRFQITTVSTA